MNTLSTVGKTKTYGLQKKKSKTATAVRPKVPLGFFDQDDDDDNGDDSMGDVQRVNKEMMKRQMQSAEARRTTVPADEAKIYDYDGSYDDFKKESVVRCALSEPSKDEPKSRYIAKIQAVAHVREKEKDRIYERRLLKERQQEDAEFGDMPKFVTSAYKQKLMEDRKWEYEDRLADAVERNTTAETRGMQGFLSNLLTKNIAMGADVERSAVSAYTAGSSRQRHKMDEEEQGQSKEPAVADSADEAGEGGQDEESEHRGQKRPHSSVSKADDRDEATLDTQINHAMLDTDGTAATTLSTRPVLSEHDTTESSESLAAIQAAAQAQEALTAEEAKTKAIKDREEAIRAAKERYAARRKQSGVGSEGGT